jgi:hypothetical protein
MTDPDKEAPELISVGAQSLVDNAERLGLKWQLRLATVVDGADTSAVIALYDGDSVNISMVSMIGSLLTGARIYVLEVPPSGNFILGQVTAAPVAANEECTSVIGMTPGTTTLAVFATVPGTPTVAFLKASSLSRLRINLEGTFYSTGAQDAGLNAGVNLGTAGDVEILRVAFTNGSLLAHTTFAGSILLDPGSFSGGLPAGPYTITGIWRRNGGTGTLNVDANDFWSCCVREVP